jgi:homogentisate 1,2-dioxygenase
MPSREASCLVAYRCTTRCCRTGPDVDAFEGASNAELKPRKVEGTMAFMFETRFPQRITAYAAASEALQKGYGSYGHHLKKYFNPNSP